MPSFIETYFVDKNLCDNLILFFNKNEYYKCHGEVGVKDGKKVDKSIKESTDVTFHNDTKHKDIQYFFEVLSVCLKKYIEKYSLNHKIKTEYCSVISMFPPLGGFKIPHYERTSIVNSKRQLVYMLYLNDVTDGGETEFIHQKIKMKAEKGKLVIWPSDFTHLHRGIVSPTQVKYIATGWLQII